MQQHIQQLLPSLPCPEMSPSSSIAGDHIGLESCLDMVKIGELELDQATVAAAADNNNYCYYSDRVQQRREQRWEMRRKEYPPPIPLLARTENLSSHMPWVLKRYYTSDGRLILREEKVRHHEYLRAHRADGRLTLHLVPMDDHFNFTIPTAANCIQDVGQDEQLCFDGDGDDDEKEGDEYEAEQIADAISARDDNNDNGDGKIGFVEEEGCVGHEHEHESEASVVVGKCLAYSVTGVGSSIFGVPISPIRPVHS